MKKLEILRKFAKARLLFIVCASLLVLIFTASKIHARLEPIPPTGHNSFDLFYRSSFGAVAAGSEPLTIRYTSADGGVSGIRLHLWDLALRQERWLTMQKSAPSKNSSQTRDWPPNWQVQIEIPSLPTVLSYFFEIQTPTGLQYALAHDAHFMTGGWSETSSVRDDSRSYKITVYDPTDHVPSWLKGAVIYQLFPDRFRNGNRANDPVDGSGWIYGKTVIKKNWQEPLCSRKNDSCGAEASQTFYGGDLSGVSEKIDELKNLGVTAIYLNPIFLAPSNHKYDTQDYLQIDPAFGTQDDFAQLVSQVRDRGMHLILDGVFNHTSSDSPFFDFYHRWPGTGACQSANSPYRSWYFLPALGFPAKDGSGNPLLCAADTANGVSYEAWSGYASLPKLNAQDPGVRDFLFAKGSSSVGPNWIQKGASGWRLDVGGSVDPGQIVDPGNGFWRGFKKAIRKIDPEAILLGEEWGDARNWLLSQEWDSVMNYRFRSAVLSWMFDECSGFGCEGSQVFRDGNDNDSSASGSIRPLSTSRFNLRLQAIQEAYPPEKWLAMMNLLDSHDTSRILFLLKKISGDSSSLAKKKLRFLALFQFTYPGSPSIYYGNEVGLAPDDFWDGRTWQYDPYNRAPYPWADQGGQPDQSLHADFAKLASLHNSLPSLQQGDYQPWLIDDEKQMLSFGRSWKGHQVWIALNRATTDQQVTLSAPNSGTSFKDVLTDEIFIPTGPALQLGVIRSLWGKDPGFSMSWIKKAFLPPSSEATLRLCGFLMWTLLTLNQFSLLWAASQMRPLFADGSWFFIQLLSSRAFTWDHSYLRLFSVILQIPSMIYFQIFPHSNSLAIPTLLYSFAFLLHPAISLFFSYRILRQKNKNEYFVFPVLSFALCTQSLTGYPSLIIPETLSLFWPLFLFWSSEKKKTFGNLLGSAF